VKIKNTQKYFQYLCRESYAAIILYEKLQNGHVHNTEDTKENNMTGNGSGEGRVEGVLLLTVTNLHVLQKFQIYIVFYNDL
jgi:hypothetical protein